MNARLVSSVLLVSLLTPFPGCSTKKTLSVAPGELLQHKKAHILSVTTLDGREIRFQAPGGTLGADKITGVAVTPAEFPESQVKRVRQVEREGGLRVENLTTTDGREVQFVQPGALKKDGKISGEIYEPVELPLAQVQRVWLEKKSFSAGKTVGLVVLIGVLVGAIAALDDPEPAPPPQSCPFVYSWDGQRFVFDGEPYGGATSRGLERDDYSELEHLQPQDGTYRLMVTNEVPETQYTNLMELWVVDHPAELRVVADDRGILHGLTHPRPPVVARDGDGRDLLPWLGETDRLIWEPPAVADAKGRLRRDVVLEFERPVGARQMTLVTHAATGFWGSQMIRQMLALHGRDLDAWYAALDGSRAGPEALMAWNVREELYVLKVEVEEPGGFQMRGLMPGGGPLIAEDRAVVLDVSRVEGDRVRVRLRPPAGFWALNSFAADFGPDRPVEAVVVKATEAREVGGADRLAELSSADDRYYEMPRPGDQASVTFPVPPAPDGTKRTVFLHSRGYYRLHLPAEGEPQREALQKLAFVPDAAAALAAERYAEWDARRVAQR